MFPAFSPEYSAGENATVRIVALPRKIFISAFFFVHVVSAARTDACPAQETLDNYIRGLDASELPFAGFASIPEATPAPRAEEGLVFSPAAVDQIAWGCSVPAKAGLYHAFTRTNANATREHKVYIIVSGCLTHAAEEWYNLWLDSGKHATCGELLECEELEWLRTATHRSHNRIAADLSSLFGVRLRIVLDTKNPVPNTLMAMPTTTTYMNDIRVAAVSHEIMLSESACFTDASDNGIIVDMFSAEGFWLFQVHLCCWRHARTRARTPRANTPVDAAGPVRPRRLQSARHHIWERD